MKTFWLIQWADGSWSRWPIDFISAAALVGLRNVRDAVLFTFDGTTLRSPASDRSRRLWLEWKQAQSAA